MLILLILAPLLAQADSVVIEALVTAEDNQYWAPQKSMHLTLGHLKNVEGTTIQTAIKQFNHRYRHLLKKSLLPGFTVKSFTANGFNRGFHILEADEETSQRLSSLNAELYHFFIKNYHEKFTDITSPKFIFPTGYTPHIEFIETNGHIPKAGTQVKFLGTELIARIQNFDRD